MAATYTHDRFGRDVYRRLPREMKRQIRSDKKLYLTGLHGPDIFFFYHPLSSNSLVKMGHEMHERKASEFFEHVRRVYRKHPEDRVLAYALGFACHHLLDSACHPYINSYRQSSGISHAMQEAELDRAFMLEDGKNPFTYTRSCGICPSQPGLRVIQWCFPGVALEDIVESLKGMKFYTSLLNQQHALLRNGLLLGMKLAGVDYSLSDQVLRKRPDEKSVLAVKNLMILYGRALEEAPDRLGGLAEYLQGNGPMPACFQTSFL